VRTRLVAAALVGAAAIGGAGWLGWRTLDRPASPAAVQVLPDDASADDLGSGDGATGVETVEGGDAQPIDQGATPMRQRVAVIGLLNKRNGVSRDLTLKPGQAVQAGDVVVRLSACERTAPWESEQLTGAFVQMNVRGADRRWSRAFSGWLYKERPGLNVVQHPIYDVWTKSCATTFPDKGSDTVPLNGEASPARRSRAPKSPSAGTVPVPAPVPNAVPSSADPSRAI